MNKLNSYVQRNKRYLLGVSVTLFAAAILLGIFIKNTSSVADKQCTEIVESDSETIAENVGTVSQAETLESEVWESAEKETCEKESTAETVERTDEHPGEFTESTSREDAKAETVSSPEENVNQPGEVSALNPEKETQESMPEKIEEADATEMENIESDPPTEPDESAATDTPAESEEHEHSWVFEAYYQKPTCSNGGLVTEICAQCGETQITGGTPTGKHTYEVEIPGDCCSEQGVVCTECNYREMREKDSGNHIDVEDGFCYGCGQKVE